MTRMTKFAARDLGPAARVAGFMAHLRDNGLRLGVSQTDLELAAFAEVDAAWPEQSRQALRAVCTRCKEEVEQFDSLFNNYWMDMGLVKQKVAQTPPKGSVDIFIEPCLPLAQLVVLGGSPVAQALMSLAPRFDLLVTKTALYETPPIHLVSSQQDINLNIIDRHSAFLTLFYDHYWEPRLLHAALQTQAQFIGCLGSSRPHAMRIEYLKKIAVGLEQLTRLKGTIGLVPILTRCAPNCDLHSSRDRFRFRTKHINGFGLCFRGNTIKKSWSFAINPIFEMSLIL